MPDRAVSLTIYNWPYLDFVYHPDRLTHPLRRVGPKGSSQWARIGWDEALAEIVELRQAIIRE